MEEIFQKNVNNKQEMYFTIKTVQHSKSPPTPST